MIPRDGAVIAVCAFLAACAGSPTIGDGPHDSRAGASDRQILVMIADPDMERLDLRGARSGVYRQGRGYPRTPARVARVLEAVASDFGLKRVDGWPMRSLGVHCAVLEVEPGVPVESVITRLDADERVESVQRMQRFEVQQSGERALWDDPYLSLQRSLEDSGITRAHRWATGRGVRIAVIDTGIDADHPDLRGQVVAVRNFMQDGAGAPGRHGTAVAGVIASVAGNRQGIVGVAPGARILALTACAQLAADGPGTCTSFSLARALDHAIVAGSDVLNLSVGGPHDALLERLLLEAMARNMVVVAAHGDRRRLFPASLRGVIAVGSTHTPADAIRLAAPDQDVLTLVPPDGYEFLSGSSFAAAHVSGIVALLLERDPSLHAREIESLLVRTSRIVGRGGGPSRMLVSACDALAELSGAIGCGLKSRFERAASAVIRTRPLEAD